MNFLAHIYLSKDYPREMIGNFMGDGVRGRDLSHLESEIARGVQLHRFIDEYTDNHPVVEKSKIRLRPQFRKYAPVIVDVFYDHFLADKWSNYHPKGLKLFVEDTYNFLLENRNVLPSSTQRMLPYMIEHNWLYNYRKIEGIDRALYGLSRRATFESKMEHSSLALEQHYSQFEEEFESFFPELIEGVNSYRNTLISS
jgi:acyl carrier protein phosphodiesterase